MSHSGVPSFEQLSALADERGFSIEDLHVPPEQLAHLHATAERLVYGIMPIDLSSLPHGTTRLTASARIAKRIKINAKHHAILTQSRIMSGKLSYFGSLIDRSITATTRNRVQCRIELRLLFETIEHLLDIGKLAYDTDACQWYNTATDHKLVMSREQILSPA